MKKALYRFIVLFLSAVLCIMTVGCKSVPILTDPDETMPNKPALSYHLTYYYDINYNVFNGDYVSDNIRQALNDFGKIQSIHPATATVETYTEIPEFENDAKGTDPIAVLFPSLNLSKYRPYYGTDAEADVTTSGCYRMIGGLSNGMMTDESITYDVDSSGNIVQYRTVNLGKYDALALDESRFGKLADTFASAISHKIGSKQDYQYVYEAASETAFRVFTDNEGRIVITATISLLQDNNRFLEVDLYAVVS